MSIHYSRFDLNTYKSSPYFAAHIPPGYPLELVLQKSRAFLRLPPNLRTLATKAGAWARGMYPALSMEMDRWYDAEGHELDPDTGLPLTPAEVDAQWPWPEPDIVVTDIPPLQLPDPETWSPSAVAEEPYDHRSELTYEGVLRDVQDRGHAAATAEYGAPPGLYATDEDLARAILGGSTVNAFCRTGVGGGVDPTCAPALKSTKEGVAAAKAEFHRIADSVLGVDSRFSPGIRMYRPDAERVVQVSFDHEYNEDGERTNHFVARFDFEITGKPATYSAEKLQPGTMGMLRKIRDAVLAYHAGGFRIAVQAADQRRSEVYRKYLTSMGLKFTKVSRGEEIYNVGVVRQKDPVSCGAAAAMAVGRSFGVGPESLAEWKEALGTGKDGTDTRAILEYLRGLGLNVEEVRLGAAEDLHGTVIVPVRMYGGGHYVVVLGVNAEGVSFMDPSAGMRTLPLDKFVALWHDEEYLRYGLRVTNENTVHDAKGRFAAAGVEGGILGVDRITGEASGINSSYVATLVDGSKGVWKPAGGEERAPRDNIPNGRQYIREAAASRVAEILGVNVPKTVVRTHEGSEGSMQKFVPGAKVALVASGNIYGNDAELAKNTAFDYVIGNTDRHYGNWMLDSEGTVHLIDNGLSFGTHPAHEQRPRFLLECIRRKLAVPEEVKRWKSEWPKVKKALTELGLEPGAVAHVKKRMDTLDAVDFKGMAKERV